MLIPATMLQALVASLIAGWSSQAVEPPAHEAAIKRYYAIHAREENGRCRAPYIDDFHRIEVVANSAEQVVVETRYRYRDWLTDRQAWRIGSDRSACGDLSSRRFVLVTSGGRLQVASMSPPERG